MADWFKFYNDGLDSKGMQFAISEQPLVTSVWLVIMSEASKERSRKIHWRDEDFELIGYARKVNVSVPIFNQCIGLLERVGFIKRANGFIEINGWDKMQSDYARGLDKGYYNNKKTIKKLASNSEETSARGEERRIEEKKEEKTAIIIEIPENIRTTEFKCAWEMWLEHLRQKKHKPTDIAKGMQLKKLGLMGLVRAIAAINFSIQQSYQGIYEPSLPNGQTPKSDTVGGRF